jgi:hypothetical protein
MPFRAEVSGNARGGFQFELVPLPIIEGKRVAGVSFQARQGQASGGIQTAAQQTDGLFTCGR